MRNDEPSSPDDAEGSGRAPSIGETLRAAREFRRASIERVSDLLRIEPRFIVALEEDRFDSIGPPVFVKGYLKHYCELLGLDPRPLLDELRERLRGADPPLQARLPAEREKAPSSAATVAAAAAVLALAAIGVWQFGGSSRDDAAEPPVAAATTDAREPAARGAAAGSGSSAARGAAAGSGSPAARGLTAESGSPATQGLAGEAGSPAAQGLAAEAGSPAAGETLASAAPVTPASSEAAPGAGSDGSSDTGGVDPASPGAASPQPLVGDRATLPAPADAAGTAAAPAVADRSAPREDSAASSTPAGGASAPDRGASAAGALEIELRFVEDSWTEITSAGGERLFYGLARAGAEERIRADGEVRVLLGNADGVIVRVNGEPFTYPAGSRSGDLARFRLSPEN
ncbi:MAG TPA: RodZ domain-containing protein [Gammaproteobacteria bacterium]